LCKKKENVLASGSHDGGLASICHPSGSIDILLPPPIFFQHRKELIVPLSHGYADAPGRSPIRASAL
jgi:hypothetical protein